MVRRRDDAKERAILAGTLAVVERQGLAGVSMEAVAREAGVAIGTLYVYFPSKEALLDALYVETKRGFARAVLENLDEREPLRPAFERMCIAYMRYVAEKRAEMVFMHQYRNAATVHEQAAEVSARATAALEALLERGKREGIFKDMATPLMIAFLQGTLAELAAWVEAQPRRARKERLADVARLAWDALKA